MIPDSRFGKGETGDAGGGSWDGFHPVSKTEGFE